VYICSGSVAARHLLMRAERTWPDLRRTQPCVHGARADAGPSADGAHGRVGVCAAPVGDGHREGSRPSAAPCVAT
jgi:hypothetical protein